MKTITTTTIKRNKTRRGLISAFILLISFSIAYSQGKHANKWIFGSNAGLDFSVVNPGFPSVITGTALTSATAEEGCASIADANGNLLFYTNGEVVWNKNHNPMPNGTGLFGRDHSSQSAIILQKPGSKTVYYVVTVDQGGYESGGTAKGVNYSIVDMTLQGGLGNVTTKNAALLAPPALEKVTAVKHSNGCDIWVIAHESRSNKFHVFLLTTGGFTGPQIQAVGSNYPLAFQGQETIGCMKASPDGKKLALASSDLHFSEILDFNSSTGVISNAITLPFVTEAPYGVSFSPNSTKLYVSTNNIPCRLYQYDLQAGNAAAIIASKYQVNWQDFAYQFGSLQLAPNGKIYMATTGGNSALHVIHSPDFLQAGCSYQVNGITFPPGSGSMLGLPNFLDNFSSPLSFSLGNDIQLACGITTTTLNAGSGWTTYSWSTGATTQTTTVSATGNYWAEVSNGSCVFRDTIHVTTGSVISIDPLSTNVNCKGQCTGTATAIVSGGLTPYNYSWSNNKTTDHITGLCAGNYTVTVRDARNCTKSVTITITEPPRPLSVAAGTIVPVDCYGNSSGNATVIASGGTSGYTYTWQPGGMTGDLQTGLAAGVYTVTVVDANGCTTTSSIGVIQPSDPVSLSVASNNPVDCKGNATGSASVLATGGNSGYSYTWQPGNLSGASVSGLSAGNYTVTVSDSKGCSSSTTLTITEPSLLEAAITSNIPVKCFGGNDGGLTVVATGGTTNYTYSWTKPGVSTASSGDLTAGTYSITITDANGCTTSVSATIIEPTEINLSVSSSDAHCNQADGSATVMATGGTLGYGYSWSNAATDAVNNGIPSGAYTVIVTDNNGCVKQASALISNLSGPAIDNTTVQKVNCFGESTGSGTVSASGGTMPLVYSWSNNLTGASQQNLPAGVYTVTVTDASNCKVLTTITITEPQAALSATQTQTDVACYGDATGAITTTVSGGTNPYNYSWNNGMNSGSIANIVSGTYHLTITDGNGCTLSKSVTLTQPSAPLASSINAQTNVKCYGDATGSAEVTVTGGTAPYNYSWNNGSVTNSISGATKGDYQLTVTDQHGCTISQSVSISQPSASLTGTANVTTHVVCYGANTGEGAITVTGGTTDYSYQWSPSGGSNAIASGLSSGTYVILVTDANNCTLSKSITVNQPAAPFKAGVSADGAVCANQPFEVSAFANGGTGNYTYSWSHGLGNGPGPFTVNPSQPTTYSVTVSDGCVTNTDLPVSVLIHPPITASFTGELVDANALIYKFTNTGADAVAWDWNFGDNTNSNLEHPDHQYEQPGKYTIALIATNQYGCQDTVLLEVPVEEEIKVPNVFSPNGDQVNDLFIVASKGVYQFNLDIYDRWGLRMFTSASAKEHWDGRTPSGAEASAATYYYVLSVKYVSGKEEAVTGYLQLVR